MPGQLTLAVAQPACTAYHVAGNSVAHADAVEHARCRVVVFPELSLTGYHLDAPPITPDDPRLAPLVEACGRTGTLALAGAVVQGGGGSAQIGTIAVDGSGARVAYRKLYLGGDEPAQVTPGVAAESVQVDGWRFGLAICKDTGVPEHAAATAALGVDGYLAGLVDHAQDAAVQEQRARRIATQHGVWVAFASFAGPTGGGFDRTAGRSGIWSPDGSELVRAGTEPGEVVAAVLHR